MEWAGKNLYLMLMLASVAGPLALSFDKRVAFWRKWKYLPIPIILTGSIFIAWDYLFTLWGVWSFNDHYVTGKYIFLLPIEEWSFFIVIPFCCLFIYECLRAYIPRDYLAGPARWLNFLVIVLCIVLMAKFPGKIYTSLHSLFVLFYLGQLIVWRKPAYLGWFYLMFAISLVPFLLVNGVLTATPVVMYDDTQNMGLRLYTIPVEDMLYLFLLLLMNLSLYEWAKSKY